MAKNKKISRSFSIEYDVYENFEKISKFLYLNNSTIIQNAIKKFIEENKEILEKIKIKEQNEL